MKLGEWKFVFWNENMNDFVIFYGIMGLCWDNEKKWNLCLEDEEIGEKIDLCFFLFGMEELIGIV